MKKKLATGLIAIPLLTLSSMAFAGEHDAQEPMLLSAQQMDDVTAGARRGFGLDSGSWRVANAVYKRAELTHINISPITIVQIGNNNTAVVFSGNFGGLSQ